MAQLASCNDRFTAFVITQNASNRNVRIKVVKQVALSKVAIGIRIVRCPIKPANGDKMIRKGLRTLVNSGIRTSD